MGTQRTQPNGRGILGTVKTASLILGLSTLTVLAATTLPHAPRMTTEIGDDHRYWKEHIAEVGAERAYDEFKQTYGAMSFGRRHTMAHLWGSALFDASGLEGVTVCDSAFEFGCYHGFFTAAVAAEGINSLAELDRACRKKFGSLASACQHGIGHGILEYFGHARLKEALEACAAVPQIEPVAGCTAGVFMEYNLPITVRADGATMQFRPVATEDPYPPCPRLPPQFHQSCYHELVQLWDRYFDYDRIGRFCAALAVPQEQDACFQGAGNVAAPSSAYDVTGTLEKCDRMPSPDGRTICRISASWSFWGQEQYRHLAAEPCRGLPASAVSRCAPPPGNTP